MTLLNRRNLVVLIVALAVTFIGANTVQGQQRQRALIEEELKLISVDFPGGTIAEYVDALAEAAGSVNVLIAPEAADISMPAVKLTKVTVAAAIDLTVGPRTDENNRDISIDVDHLKRYENNEQSTFRISVQAPSRRVQAIELPQTKVWSIAYLMKDDVFDSKVVLDAVESLIRITQSRVQTEISFHEATGLLIASGSPHHLNSITELLRELGQSSQMNSFKEDKKLKRELSSVTQQLHRMLNEAPKIKQKLAQLEAENRDLRRAENRRVRLLETQRILDERNNLLEKKTSELQELKAKLDIVNRQNAKDDKSGNKDN